MAIVSSSKLYGGETANTARTLRELSLGIAHDVRNPLAAAKCLTALMQRNQSCDADMRRYIEEIDLQLDYAADILTAFCDIYRPAEAQAERVNLPYLCHQTVSIFNGMALLRGIKLREEYAYQGDVCVRRGYLAQILINLLKNAIDASEEGSVITISAGEEGDKLRVSVRDCGKGMDEQELSNIFAAYYTTKEKGTGLGLNISMHIAAVCGWDIEAASAPGEGAEFSVILPGQRR